MLALLWIGSTEPYLRGTIRLQEIPLCESIAKPNSEREFLTSRLFDVWRTPDKSATWYVAGTADRSYRCRFLFVGTYPAWLVMKLPQTNMDNNQSNNSGN